jgi:hypothetical protein
VTSMGQPLNPTIWLADRWRQRRRRRLDPVLAEALAHFEAMDAAATPDERRVEADLAFTAYEAWCGKAGAVPTVGPHDLPRPCSEGRRAIAALESGRLDQARRYATAALDMATAWTPARFGRMGSGLAEHWMMGEEVLGRLALRAGNTAEAEQRLLASFERGHLMVSSPRFDLARELVEAGHVDAVVAYLGLCRRVRWRGRRRLPAWEAEVRGGRSPPAWARHPAV